MNKITNKRIIDFMMRQILKTGNYWIPIKFGQKYYVMSFQYNVFESHKGK